MGMALAPDDWIRAALYALAEGGVAAVAVEPLASRLGATKGSFYWHFKSRDELLEQALLTWEREATDEFIEELAGIAEPRERLRTVLEEAMAGADDRGPADIAVLAAASDPRVAPILARVQRKRLDFLARCFRELGFAPPAARQRALLAYSAYLGWYDLAATEGRPPTARELAAYQRTVIDVVTAC